LGQTAAMFDFLIWIALGIAAGSLSKAIMSGPDPGDPWMTICRDLPALLKAWSLRPHLGGQHFHRHGGCEPHSGHPSPNEETELRTMTPWRDRPHGEEPHGGV
jgi:hypothetical protein